MIKFKLTTKDGEVRQVVAEKLVMTEQTLHFESNGEIVGDTIPLDSVLDCRSIGEVDE